MASLGRLLPQSLVARVYLLYTVTLLLFFCGGLWIFYHYQFREAMEDAQDSATMLVEVAAQTISDSAVIGDYDTIKRTLDKAILRSKFSSASFIDLAGGVIERGNTQPAPVHPPAWLRDAVAVHLYAVNRPISVGGRDYGVLRLNFAVDQVAANLWQLIQATLGLALAGFAGGLLLIWFPLRHWLGSLQSVNTFKAEFTRRGDSVARPLSQTLPLEFRSMFEILEQTANSLRNELGNREKALGSLRARLPNWFRNTKPGARLFRRPWRRHSQPIGRKANFSPT
jgi:cbb3-type cytochrome oxidase subunit 3